MKAVIALALILTFAPGAHAEESLDTTRFYFLELRKASFKPQEDLDSKYEAQLDTLMTKAQADAALELAVEIRKEKESFRSEPAKEAKIDRIKDPQLAKLREIYAAQSKKLREARIKSWESLYGDYVKSLTKYRDEATKAGKIDEALKTDAEIKSIQAEIDSFKQDAGSSGALSTATETAGDLESMAAAITGEWYYRDNGRPWRRIFKADGKIELWLDGARDGTWLSELNWKTEKRGIVTGAWIYKGGKEVGRLKLKDGGKAMKWEGGPEMTKGEPTDLWKKK